MNFSTSARTLIEKYGDTVIISQGETERRGKAVIEPLMYKNKMYLGGNVTSAGYLDESHYVMTAPPELLGDDPGSVVITHRGEKYIVERCEVVSVADEDLYLWAVIESYGEEAEDDY